MTLNELEVNLLLRRPCYAYCGQTAEAIELRGFHYKVPLYISYPHIKYYDGIQKKSIRISNIYFKLICRLSSNASVL